MTWKRSAVAAVAVMALVAGATVSYAVSRDGDDVPAEPTTLGPAEWPARAEVSGEYPRPDIISEQQWAMVQDGWVTDEEMRAAEDATVACAVEAGITLTVVPGPPGDVRGTLTHVSESSDPSWEVRDCKLKSMDAVSMLYGSQTDTRTYTTQEGLDSRWDACLANQGFEGPLMAVLERRIADPAAAAAIDACNRTVNTVAARASLEVDAQYATIEACLAAHGYSFPPLAGRTEPVWTPERLNAINDVPDLAPIWRTCRLVGQVAALAETR